MKFKFILDKIKFSFINMDSMGIVSNMSRPI